MQLLGAKVHTVESGTQTLKDAINDALRDWTTNVQNTYYLLVRGRTSSLPNDSKGFSKHNWI